MSLFVSASPTRGDANVKKKYFDATRHNMAGRIFCIFYFIPSVFRFDIRFIFDIVTRVIYFYLFLAIF